MTQQIQLRAPQFRRREHSLSRHEPATRARTATERDGTLRA
ncbi:hypothetical protein [Salinispora arenicola]|nr:hypothetical protein [Salinispora arenicola]